jgi:transposase-like protein
MEKRRTVDRPSKEVLLQELKESNFTQVGKKYGVSDNTIRKWCRNYDLPTHTSEIKVFEL